MDTSWRISHDDPDAWILWAAKHEVSIGMQPDGTWTAELDGIIADGDHKAEAVMWLKTIYEALHQYD